MFNYKCLYHLIDYILSDNIKFVNSFSHYSEIGERSAMEMYNFEDEFHVGIHFVSELKERKDLQCNKLGT